MSENLANSLLRRVRRYPYPDAALINSWLQVSTLLLRDRDTIRFTGQISELTEIEEDIVEILACIGKTDYPTLKRLLAEKGHKEDLITATITRSPIIHVDRSAGRKRHLYELLPEAASEEDLRPDARYELFRDRLQKVMALGTDVSQESTRRREQHILQEWLFSDAKSADCAICGRKFSTEALVAAHKKKRSLCKESERGDPYIVFPLCIFGCDYLYERNVLMVENGVVTAGVLPPEGTADHEHAVALIGRRIADLWLKGANDYFRKGAVLTIDTDARFLTLSQA